MLPKLIAMPPVKVLVKELTVNTAETLVAELVGPFDTTHTNEVPLSVSCTLGIVWTESFAPVMATLFFFHWNVIGNVLVAETLKEAL